MQEKRNLEHTVIIDYGHHTVAALNGFLADDNKTIIFNDGSVRTLIEVKL